MKKFNIIFGFALSLVLFMSACTEKEIIFPQFETLEKGAFARLLGGMKGPNGGDFNYFDVAGSKMNFEVEFYDENQGKNVESFSVSVRHAPTNKSAALTTVTSANFGTSVNGFPNAKFEFTFQQILTALGIKYEDVAGGQAFVCTTTLKMKDGRTFTQANSTADLELPAFANLTRFNINLTCPSDFAGTYTYDAKGWCGTTKKGSIKLVEDAVRNGIYEPFLDGGAEPDFSFGAYGACYAPGSALPGGTLKLVDACNKLSFSGASRWGEIYTFNSIVIAGPNLTFDWKNDYFPEAGVVTITRSDSKAWPPFRK